MVRLIKAEEIVSLQQKHRIALLDVRPLAAFEAGAIPGARFARPLFELLVDRDRGGLAGFRRDLLDLTRALELSAYDPVIVYEASLNTGLGASCRGALLLHWIGFRDVAVLDGGYEAWLARSGDRTTDIVPRAAECDRAFPEAIVDVAAVLAALTDPSTDIVDVRDPMEWAGDSGVPVGQPPIRPSGRIPGAKWLPWREMMGADARFLPADEIRSLALAAGLHPERRTILYCYRGARAANTWMALKQAGFLRLQLYLGSWHEWSAGGFPMTRRI